MRIHDIEIYSSKQMLAFIGYLQAWAEDRAKQEEQEKLWQNSAYGNGLIGGLGAANIAAQVTEKCRAQASTQKAADMEKAEG